MRYMLDTCTFVFAANDSDRLSKEVQLLLEDWENEFCISVETVRELIVAIRNKGLHFNNCKTEGDLIRMIEEDYYITILPLNKEHVQTYSNLTINTAEDHKDPSDHMIISHAITNKIPLISCDHKFKFYQSQGLQLIYYHK